MDLTEAYKTLELETGSSICQVKRAYRRLSLAYHPDKNRDSNCDTFLKINQAYRFILSFDQLKDNSSVLQTQLIPNEYQLTVTLEEILNDCVKTAKITRKIIDENYQEHEEEDSIEIQIHRGCLENFRITIPQAGDRKHGMIPANAVFVVRYETHELFNVSKQTRFGLEYIAQISAEQAILGQIQIPTLECETISLELTEIITQNTVERIANQGLPIPNDPSQKRGDLLVLFDIVFDKRRRDSQIKHVYLTLEEILNFVEEMVEEIYSNEVKFKFEQDEDPENIINSDIIYIIHDLPHRIFKRNKVNLEYTALVSLNQFFDGETIEIPTLYETEFLQLSLNQIAKANEIIIFEGHGLPHLNNPNKRGDIIVNLEVDKRLDVYPKNKYYFPELEIFEEPQERKIYLTLKEVFYGCSKILKTKQITIDPNCGREVMNELSLQIEIQPGTETGTKFVFENAGNRCPGRIVSDAIFVVQDVSHPSFVRDGANILFTALITENEAQNGFQPEIPTLDVDEQIEATYIEPIKQGQIKRFKGKGLPHFANLKTRGDLIVKFQIVDDEFKDPPIVQVIELSLETILQGQRWQMPFMKCFFDLDGRIQTKETFITIDLKPGISHDREFHFPRMGNSVPGRISADFVFQIQEKFHSIFKRNGNDLECIIKLTEREIYQEKVHIPILCDDGQLVFPLNDEIVQNRIKRIANYGLPNEYFDSKGDLVVKFEINDNDVVLDSLKKSEPQIVKLTLKEIVCGCRKEVQILDLSGKCLEERTTKIYFKPGSIDGTRFWWNVTNVNQLIEIVVEEIPDERFKRCDLDLYLTLKITLKQALCGGYIEISNFRTSFPIYLNEIVKPSESKEAFRNQGIWIYKNSAIKRCGNLIVNYDVQFPKILSPNVKNRLSKIFDPIFEDFPSDLNRFKTTESGTYYRNINKLDLECTAVITLQEALCGLRLDLPDKNKSLDLSLKNGDTKVMNPKQVKLISGAGRQGEDNHCGDLFVHFEFVFPKYLTCEQKSEIRNLLL